jgi:membrane protease YdiL (CAAX protease family)
MSDPVRFAGFWRRLLAVLIDNVVWFIGVAYLVAPLVGDDPTAGAIVGFAVLTAWFNYFAIAEWRYGQTIGKNILDLRVVPVDANVELTYNAAAVRNLLRLIDGPLTLIGVEYFIVERSPRRQRLGDRAAHTVVLHEQGLPMAGPPPSQRDEEEGSGTPAASAPAAPTAADLFADATAALGGGGPGGVVGAGRGPLRGKTVLSEEWPPPPPTHNPGAPPPSEPEPEPSSAGEGVAREVTWGPREAILGVLGALVAGLLLGIPALIVDNPPPSGDLSTGANIWLQLATVVGFVGAAIYVATRDGAALPLALRRLGVRPFRPAAVGWMLLAAFVYLVLAALYAALVGTPKQDDIASSFGPVWVQVFLIVICAATSEELCFRGMLFGGLRKRLPAIGAALLSGAIFGGLHAITGITAVPPLIIFGVVLALLYEKTGSILPGVILHALNNTVALLGQ